MTDYPYQELTEEEQTDPVSMQARMRILNQRHLNKPGAVPIYLQVTGGELGEALNATNVMQMGQYVNPELALNTDYFRSLDSMMQCVERNAALTDVAAQQKACQKEWSDLRLAAFKNKLLYSQVNKRFFMRELQFKSGYGGF